MTDTAWIFMSTAWAVIIAMTLYFFARLITSADRVIHPESEEPTDRPEPYGAPPTLPKD